jgi:queuosine biosynthesis protein QueD
MAGFYEVMIERDFSSAHQLRGYKGKCENLHGHNYKLEIYAKGEELNNIGLLIDFVELKKAADEIVKYLDHRNLNELPPFDKPTLYSESARVPQITGTGRAGSGGQIPQAAAIEPPMVGNTSFTVGVTKA